MKSIILAACMVGSAFGAEQIYPSVLNGESWTMGDPRVVSSRFDPQCTNITFNSVDGSYRQTQFKVRMNVLTTTGYDQTKITTYNRTLLRTKGYMQAANDWKNVEITGFFKVNDCSPDITDNFSLYSRGGKHSPGSTAPECEGSALKGSFHYNGNVRVAKEAHHNNYFYTSYVNSQYPTMTSAGFVGLKQISYNKLIGGVLSTVTEMYVNKNGDQITWTPVLNFTDSGTFGGNASFCGKSPSDNQNMPLTWGGPMVTFRWDSCKSVDFKGLSVREIVAPV